MSNKQLVKNGSYNPETQPVRSKQGPGLTATTVGLIGDIHANLPALTAILHHAVARHIRHFWNVGDAIGYGPFPDEVVRALQAPDIISIAGNCDLKTLKIGCTAAAGGQPKPNRHPAKQLAFEWAYRQLTGTRRAALTQLPRERRLRRHGRRILLTHGSPASNKEYVDGDTPLQRLRELARLARADIVVCGHAHRQFKRKVAGVWFINPGSVGCPDDGDPRAGYASLQFTARGIRIRHYRVPYDMAPVRAAMRRHNLPKAFTRMLTCGMDFEQATNQQAATHNMAFLDFGTNAARLAVFAVKSGVPPMLIMEKRIVTRLGADITDGRLDGAAMRRALSAACRMTALARTRHAAITAVATAAVRDSTNRAEFCARFLSVTGVPLQVISGEREAHLIYKALARDIPADEPALLMDIGGGSTELIIGTASRIYKTISLPLGAVRLTEEIPALRDAGPVSAGALRQARASALKMAGTRLYALRRYQVATAIGVAGTAGAVGALTQSRRHPTMPHPNGLVVQGNFPAELAEQLRRLTLAQRRCVPGMMPDRADIILAGLVIMTVILQALNIKRLRISSRSLRDGLLMEKTGAVRLI